VKSGFSGGQQSLVNVGRGAVFVERDANAGWLKGRYQTDGQQNGQHKPDQAMSSAEFRGHS